MPIRLISLAILLSFFRVEFVYSDENNFLLPKNKPSVFKEIKDIKKPASIIPAKKPKSQSEKTQKVSSEEIKKKEK